MNPLPTPFDIIDFPYFPAEPGLLAWTAMLLFFLLLISSAYLPARRKKPRKAAAFFPFREAEAAIKKLSTARAIKKDDLFELCRKLKTVVHAYEEQDLSSLSPKALSEFSIPQQSATLARYLSVMANLDKMKYRLKIEQKQTRILLAEMLAVLNEYKLLLRASLDEEQSANPTK